MGLVINAIFIIIIAIAGSVAFVHYYPETAKAILIAGISKAIPTDIKIELEELKNQLPENLQDIIDKNPQEEEDFIKEIPFPESDVSRTLLGRPKKIVEFFCSTDSHCSTYFKNSKAKCEATSGICYLD